MRKILSYMRRAVEDYHMIEEGDKIAVGVSGGKDSVTLLLALKELQRFYPKKFELIGLTLDMGFEGFDASALAALCEERAIPYIVEKTNFKEVIFDIRKESNPCSLCAKMRRGALNDLAKKHGCNKIALGHHYDDVVETFFLCLLYEGRIGCFSPVTHLTRADVYQIRPLIYAPEKEIRSIVKRMQFPTMHNPCPANGKTTRQDMKDMLNLMNKDNRGVKKRVFGALIRSGIDGWGLDKKINLKEYKS